MDYTQFRNHIKENIAGYLPVDYANAFINVELMKKITEQNFMLLLF